MKTITSNIHKIKKNLILNRQHLNFNKMLIKFRKINKMNKIKWKYNNSSPI